MNNNQNSPMIKEDTPEYRSIMIQQPVAGLPPMPRALPMAPLKRFSPAPIQQKAVPVTGALPEWKVNEVPSLPAMYRLERNNVYVDATAQEVANRVCVCLQRESISASFSEHDQNRLVAETNSCTRFAVRLFADQGKIVVEAQRMEGCSFEFQQASRCVLKSAKGIQAAISKPSLSLPKCIPKETQEDKEKCVKEGLEIAFGLYQQGRLDGRHMAIQSVEHILRTTDCKAYAANFIISGPFLPVLTNLVEAPLAPDKQFEASPEVTDRFERMKRRLALAILANCFAALDQSRELKHAMSANSKFSSESFLTALLTDLRTADERPHESCHSARCIQYLAKTSAVVKEELIALGAMNFATFALNQGSCRSAMLEAESKNLRYTLSDNVNTNMQY